MYSEWDVFSGQLLICLFDSKDDILIRINLERYGEKEFCAWLPQEDDGLVDPEIFFDISESICSDILHARTEQEVKEIISNISINGET